MTNLEKIEKISVVPVVGTFAYLMLKSFLNLAQNGILVDLFTLSPWIDFLIYSIFTISIFACISIRLIKIKITKQYPVNIIISIMLLPLLVIGLFVSQIQFGYTTNLKNISKCDDYSIYYFEGYGGLSAQSILIPTGPMSLAFKEIGPNWLTPEMIALDADSVRWPGNYTDKEKKLIIQNKYPRVIECIDLTKV